MQWQNDSGKMIRGAYGVVLAIALFATLPANAADPQPQPLKSGVVSADAARTNQARWGRVVKIATPPNHAQ